MARSPQEIFHHHGRRWSPATWTGSWPTTADDSVYITPRGELRGLDEIRQAYVEFLADLPDAELDVPDSIFEGDVLYLEWTAEAPTVPRHGRHRHLRLQRRRDPAPHPPLHDGAGVLGGPAGAPRLTGALW